MKLHATISLVQSLNAGINLTPGSGGGITPTGTLDIYQNGNYDVRNFANAHVDIATGGIEPEKLTFSQVNGDVANYLAYVTEHPYDPDDYSYSYIEQFVSGVTNGDKPLGTEISVQAGKLAISDNSGTTEIKTVSVGTQTIYNIAPTSDGGNYINTDANGNIVGCGHLIPTGALRMIKCAATRNVRDLGGWTCDGGTVKYGKLFRGGVPSASDRSVLVNWLGISAEIDLRGRAEAQGATESPLGSDVRYYLYDSYAMYSIADKALWRIMLADIFDCVAKGEKVYFNCSMGADRTGTLACIIEGILGVSQSDIDIDYELTSFYTTRARNGNYQGGTADWSHLISAITAMSGESFRDKCVTFVATLGFSANEINAFRSAMINGNPEPVYPSIETFTVTNNLIHVSSDNDDDTAVQYQAYEANILPDMGYIISNVEVFMDNEDITNSVWNGQATDLYFSITNNLSNCSNNNAAIRIISRQTYYATITANSGYTLDGATVSITMGGVDVSTQYYSNGTIAIPSVTGNIVINISAVQSAPSYTNQIPISQDENGNVYNTVGYKNGYRLNSSGAETAYSGLAVTGFIPFEVGSTINFRKFKGNESSNGSVCFYNASHVYIACKKYNGMITEGILVADEDLIYTPASTIQDHGSGTQKDISSCAYIRIGAAEEIMSTAICTIDENLP